MTRWLLLDQIDNIRGCYEEDQSLPENGYVGEDGEYYEEEEKEKY